MIPTWLHPNFVGGSWLLMFFVLPYYVSLCSGFPCCDARYDFLIQTMFTSCLALGVCSAREDKAVSASYKTPAMLRIYTVKSSKSIGSDRGMKTF
jgi:hypothetical protein